MKNAYIIGLVVVVLLVIFGVWYYMNANVNTQQGVVLQNQDTLNTQTPQVKEFNITGSNFKFSVTNISVKKGDVVKINFVNEEGTHDWVIDEFSTRTNILKVGESQTIQFTADKIGQFEYYCSVGTHRAMGMKGTLIVE